MAQLFALVSLSLSLFFLFFFYNVSWSEHKWEVEPHVAKHFNSWEIPLLLHWLQHKEYNSTPLIWCQNAVNDWFIGSFWPAPLLLCSGDIFFRNLWPAIYLATHRKARVRFKKDKLLTPVWSCDSPHPSDRWGNNYGPGGIRQLPRVRDCTCCPSRCPSPGRTWTAHRGPRWRMAPPSGQLRVSFRATLLWNGSWRLTSAFGSGNWVSASTGRTRTANGWTRAAPSSGLPCFSQCICWWRGRPPSQPQWRRGRQSRKTSRRSRCTFCHRRVCRWGLLHCWRCKQWCQLCCSDLMTRKGRRGWRGRKEDSIDWSITAAVMKPKNSHDVRIFTLDYRTLISTLITWGTWRIKVLTFLLWLQHWWNTKCDHRSHLQLPVAVTQPQLWRDCSPAATKRMPALRRTLLVLLYTRPTPTQSPPSINRQVLRMGNTLEARTTPTCKQ